MGKINVCSLSRETLSVEKTLTRLLRAAHPRPRTAGPLASATAFEPLPDLIPCSYKSLSSLLNSVLGLYLRPSSETKCGKLACPTR
jgi:hypothetical protein